MRSSIKMAIEVEPSNSQYNHALFNGGGGVPLNHNRILTLMQRPHQLVQHRRNLFLVYHFRKHSHTKQHHLLQHLRENRRPHPNLVSTPNSQCVEWPLCPDWLRRRLWLQSVSRYLLRHRSSSSRWLCPRNNRYGCPHLNGQFRSHA